MQPIQHRHAGVSEHLLGLILVYVHVSQPTVSLATLERFAYVDPDGIMIMPRSNREQHGCGHPSGRLWNEA